MPASAASQGLPTSGVSTGNTSSLGGTFTCILSRQACLLLIAASILSDP